MRSDRLALLILLLAGCSSGPEPIRLDSPTWPRSYEDEGDKVVVFDPQIDGDWKDYKHLHARSVVVLTPQGSQKEYDGVLEYDVDTEVDPDTREVLFEHRVIQDVRFPGLPKETAEKAAAVVEAVLAPEQSYIIPLDFVLAYVSAHRSSVPSVKVNLDPPPIFVSQQPSILVMFMGEPEFKPVPGLSLQYATNTNWDVFLAPSKGQYYLLNGQGWITTHDLRRGPWETAPKIPSEFQRLPPDKNWEDVRAQLPGKVLPAPRVFFSAQPAELILIEGQPIVELIPETQLSFISNTVSQLFRHEPTGQYYFLTSGRWFRSDRLEGPWKAATEDLPADFSKIPRDHRKAEVLASVPGTQEAADAVLLAQVPRRATVNRADVTVSVTYDGPPQLVAIEGTGVEYVVNSPYQVFVVKGKYYCCHQAVWFESTSASGPWVVCSSVPAEIYKIPSTHPAYPVTYVRVYESTPTTVVVGYTSGYTGMYVASGVVMFGMGMAIAASYPYPYYHCGPAYYGYGCGAHYSYYSGGYYSGARYYGPYGGAGWGASYNPATGTYARGAAAYGPGGSRYFAEAYNPYTGRYAARSGGSTPYGQWGRGVTAQGDAWARGGYVQNSRGTVAAGENSAGGKAVAARSAGGDSAYVARDRYGDLYAGRDGNVYKKSDGQWQQRQGDSWAPVDNSRSDTSRSLQQDASARSRGWQNSGRSSSGGGRASGRGGRR